MKPKLTDSSSQVYTLLLGHYLPLSKKKKKRWWQPLWNSESLSAVEV